MVNDSIRAWQIEKNLEKFILLKIDTNLVSPG